MVSIASGARIYEAAVHLQVDAWMAAARRKCCRTRTHPDINWSNRNLVCSFDDCPTLGADPGGVGTC